MRLYIDLCRAFSDARPMRSSSSGRWRPGSKAPRAVPHAHEVLKADVAIQYLEKRGGYEEAIDMLKAAKAATRARSPSKDPPARARIAMTSARSSTAFSTA